MNDSKAALVKSSHVSCVIDFLSFLKSDDGFIKPHLLTIPFLAVIVSPCLVYVDDALLI